MMIFFYLPKRKCPQSVSFLHIFRKCSFFVHKCHAKKLYRRVRIKTPPLSYRKRQNWIEIFKKLTILKKNPKFAKKLNPELRIVRIFQKSKLFQKNQKKKGPFFEKFAKNCKKSKIAPQAKKFWSLFSKNLQKNPK